MSLNNLGRLYFAQGRYKESEPLFLRALRIDKRVLGPIHPNVATLLDNLAVIYANTGRKSDADKMEKRATEIRSIKQ